MMNKKQSMKSKDSMKRMSTANGAAAGRTSDLKKVGNYLIELNRILGAGQYGKVYLASEVQTTPIADGCGSLAGSQGDAITGQKTSKGSKYVACKVVERQNLKKNQEKLIVSEIQNQDAVDSDYVTKL